MIRKFVLLFLLLVPMYGLGQACVPGNGVTCTTFLGLWQPPYNYPNWNTVVNYNWGILDSASIQNVKSINGVVGPFTFSGSGVGCSGTSCIFTAGTGAPGGFSGQIQWNNGGAFAGLTLNGDCTLVTSSGGITCTQSNGMPFGSAAFASASSFQQGTVSGGFVPYASGSNTLANTNYANGNIDTGSLYNAIVDGGATGNGTTDDTAALTAGCKAATTANKIFYLPGNSFKVTGTVTCNPSSSAGNVIRIQGVPYVTQIVSTSATADILHLGNNHSCGGLTCGSIKGVNLVGPTSTPAQNGQRALVLDDLTQFVVDTVNVSNTDIGFDMIDNCYGSVYFNVRGGFFGNNNVGLYMRTGSQSGNQIFVNDSWISGKLGAVYMSPGADGLYVTRGQFSMINTTSATQAVFMIGIDYLTSAIGGVGTVSIDKVDTEGPGGWWIHSYGTVNLTLDKGDFLANGSNPTEGVLKAENAATSRFELDNVEWGGSAGYAAAQPITISGDYGNSFLHTQGWNANAGSLSFNGSAWQTNYAMDPVVISHALSGLTAGSADYRPYNTTNTTHYQDGLYTQVVGGVMQVSTNAPTASPTWTILITGAGGTMTGSLGLAAGSTAPTPATGNNSTLLATTQFVANAIAASQIGATYYMTTPGNGGSDSNPGTLASPWSSPNHPVNCGDTIIAASATYNAAYIGFGVWGTVTPTALATNFYGGHCVAWVKCATAFACITSASTTPGGEITASHWALEGFVATTTAGNYPCFEAYPPTNAANLQDILFVNDIANGCYGGGFVIGNDGTASVDYFNVVASIAYNAAQTSSVCTSGINLYQPTQTDTLSGTHLYVTQNFTYGNVDPNPCNGTTPSDGEGIIFDTPTAYSYAQQIVAENNIAMFNGSNGIEVCSSNAPITIQNNTVYGNNTDSALTTSERGEVAGSCARNTNMTVTKNITQTTAATSGGNNLYNYYMSGGDATSTVAGNFGYSAAGNNTDCAVGSCTGFSFGSNAFGTAPGFASPPGSIPAAPSCSSFATVPACMATIIADFVPSASGTNGLGYQAFSNTPSNDALYPQWLCQYKSQLTGLVTQGCAF